MKDELKIEQGSAQNLIRDARKTISPRKCGKAETKMCKMKCFRVLLLQKTGDSGTSDRPILNTKQYDTILESLAV